MNSLLLITVVCCCFCVLVNGAPAGVKHGLMAVPGVSARAEKLTLMRQPSPSAQYHAQDELGQYTYGYSSADGQAKAEIKGIDGSIAGKYSYIDAHGKRVEVSYVADKNGFRAVGDNIPKGVPPLPHNLAKAYEEANQRLADAHSQVDEEKEEAEVGSKRGKGEEEGRGKEEGKEEEGGQEEEEEEEENEGGEGKKEEEEEEEEEEEGNKEGKGEERKSEVKPVAQVPVMARPPLPLHQQSFVFGVTADGRYAVAPVTFAMAAGHHHQQQPKLIPHMGPAYVGPKVVPYTPQKAVPYAGHYTGGALKVLPYSGHHHFHQQPQQFLVAQPYHHKSG